MMMKLAGGAGSVHPLDFNNRKRPVPRWVWLAVGASLLVHGAAGVWLYQQRFELRAPEATPEPPTTIIEIMQRPRPPEPEVAQTQPPPTAIHRPAPNPVQRGKSWRSHPSTRPRSAILILSSSRRRLVRLSNLKRSPPRPRLDRP
ncbi:hypothetical protein [Brevundimonas abyssalis]|uniref:hypothetical protein n=1 Tax=Brevundimonas abyssalis TaxID=1125965 RepID=UPI001F593052|nr:hypothetical protein [Brevundimonas abyssalis]